MKNKTSLSLDSVDHTITRTQASSQLFYISKTKQEVKGWTISTPKGYGIVQNVIPEKNIITAKINNEIIDFERSEVSKWHLDWVYPW